MISWLKDNWPYAAQSVYDRKSIFHFAMLLPAVVSPFFFPATIVGIAKLLRDRARWLIAAIPLLVLVVHSLLTATGKMASNGELRYLLVVAPFWAVLAAEGWTSLSAQLHWRHTWGWIAIASLFPLILNNHLGIGPVRLGYQILPLHFMPDWLEARDVADLVGHGDLRNQYPKLLASNVAIYYFLDESFSGPSSLRENGKRTSSTQPRRARY